MESSSEEKVMEGNPIRVVFERCCGLDIHKKMIVACQLTWQGDGKVKKETRTFSTMLGGLLELLEWLKKGKCTHVAMESTGVYWKPNLGLAVGGAIPSPTILIFCENLYFFDVSSIKPKHYHYLQNIFLIIIIFS
jgi:hypothetical protein